LSWKFENEFFCFNPSGNSSNKQGAADSPTLQGQATAINLANSKDAMSSNTIRVARTLTAARKTAKAKKSTTGQLLLSFFKDVK
jgi:hypothetical protein